MAKKKRVICDIHDDIHNLAQALAKDKDESPEGFRTRVKRIAGRIMELVEEANDRGAAMEMRLVEYSEAIHGLGFVREPPTKPESESEPQRVGRMEGL